MASTIEGLALGLAIGLFIAFLSFQYWKLKHTKSVRTDAVARSLAVTAGKVHEQLAPYFTGCPFNPKDARFLGTPIDFVVFDGLDDDEVRRVLFVEVKTGASALNGRQRRVKEAIQGRRVEWMELRVGA